MITLEPLRILDKEVGIIVKHNKSNGERCGYVAYWTWAKGAQHYTIVQKEPLTLNPSIICPNCSLHGFIREGQFV